MGYADGVVQTCCDFCDRIRGRLIYCDGVVRLDAEDAEIAPGDPAWTVEGQNQDFIDFLRGVDGDGQDLAVLGVNVFEALVKRAQA